MPHPTNARQIYSAGEIDKGSTTQWLDLLQFTDKWIVCEANGILLARAEFIRDQQRTISTFLDSNRIKV